MLMSTRIFIVDIETLSVSYQIIFQALQQAVDIILFFFFFFQRK